MTSAIIGHTGFVGGNLVTQVEFDARYNSSNIEDIAGRSYDLVVCSGARAEKWRINQEPERDRAELQRLQDCLRAAHIEQLVLISTVDVYPEPFGVDEGTPIDVDAASAYGRHRRELELWAESNFDTVVVRLPGLFGRGLKKNAIYDLLHDNMVDRIHADARFQFYDLSSLWRDIETAMEHRLHVVNFATPPVSMQDVARRAFGTEFDNRPDGVSPPSYDMRTRHHDAYGGPEGYITTREDVLDRLAGFVERERTAVVGQ